MLVLLLLLVRAHRKGTPCATRLLVGRAKRTAPALALGVGLVAGAMVAAWAIRDLRPADSVHRVAQQSDLAP